MKQMNKSLIVVLLFCIKICIYNLAAQPFELPDKLHNANTGYIITLDNKSLTGYIGEIYYADFISSVIFINDFGTPYKLRAELIKGFVFEHKNQIVEYASLHEHRTNSWAFLRVVVKGDAAILYKSPEEKMGNISYSDAFGTRIYNANEYWIKFKNEQRPFRLTLLNFKKQLKRRLIFYPEIARELGKSGYRFKDIEFIVQEINKAYLTRRRTI
jgi:hypothetical protein